MPSAFGRSYVCLQCRQDQHQRCSDEDCECGCSKGIKTQLLWDDFEGESKNHHDRPRRQGADPKKKLESSRREARHARQDT